MKKGLQAMTCKTFNLMITLYQFYGVYGGACGVMVIVVRNRHSDTITFHIALIPLWKV